MRGKVVVGDFRRGRRGKRVCGGRGPDRRKVSSFLLVRYFVEVFFGGEWRRRQLVELLLFVFVTLGNRGKRLKEQFEIQQKYLISNSQSSNSF